MVSKFAASVLAALGLAAPAAHAPKSAQPKSAQSHSNAAHASRRQALPAIFVVGHGWGHGVGLAQYGAYGYALHGWSFDQIVGHYFPDTTLGDTQKKSVRVLLAPAARRVVVSSRAPFWLRDGRGMKHKLLAGSYAFGPTLKIKLRPAKPARKVRPPLLFSPGAAPLEPGGEGRPAAVLLPGRRAARAGRAGLPRRAAGENGRPRPPGREHGRTRLVPARSRPVGDAEPLAGRGAGRAGDRRPHLRARAPARRRLRRLLGHAQPGLRRDRSRGRQQRRRRRRDRGPGRS